LNGTAEKAFFVKQQMNESLALASGEFNCVSLDIEKVFQFSVSVVFSFEATGAS